MLATLSQAGIRDEFLACFEDQALTQAGQRRRRIGRQQCCRTDQGQPARRLGGGIRWIGLIHHHRDRSGRQACPC